jgi:predicted outer membrane repeat protein
MRAITILLIFTFVVYGKDFKVHNAKEFYIALKRAENNQESDRIILTKNRYIASQKYRFEYISNEDYDLTIEADEGLRQGDVIIDGNKLSSVLKIENQKKMIISLNRLTIQNGKTKGNGAGILVKNKGDLNLDQVTVAFNKSKYDGAGVYTNGSVIVNESIIARNESLRGVGGGLFAGRNTIVKLSTISYNKSHKHGGAIFSTKAALIKDSTLSFNTSSYGGAFYGESKLRSTHTIFSNNNADYNGGAIKATNIKLFDVNISKNEAKNYGGAIISENIKIYNSTFIDNNAKYGGVIFSNNIQISETLFQTNSASYNGGALKANNIVVKESQFIANKSRRKGGAIDGNQVIVTNSKFIQNISGKGGAIFSKRITITNSDFMKNGASISGGALKGFELKIRYSALCENVADRSGGAIDGVNSVITNSNISQNKSYKGGAIFSNHTSKVNLTNSLMFHNRAYFGGAVFGNVKIFNSLLIDNYAEGMTLYGKGTLINNVIRNLTAPNLISKEVFMTGDLKLENNYLNMSNIFNYKMYKLNRYGNMPLKSIKDDNDLSNIFGKQSYISQIGLHPNLRQKCQDIFNVHKAYKSLIKKVLVDQNQTDEDDGEIASLKRNRKKKSRTSLLADINDLMIEGEQKVFYELYFVIIVRNGKNPIKEYWIDFDDEKGFQKIKGNTVTYRFHNAGIKDIKVKIIDSEKNVISKTFSVDIYDLTQEEFRALLQDKDTREYLEKLSKGILKVAEDQKGSKYSEAVEIFKLDKENKDNALSNKYGKLFQELEDETASSNEFNISKMIKFNNGITEVKEYILSNLEEFNLVSKEDSKTAIENAKNYILENPGEFNLTNFKNYEEILYDIKEQIFQNLDEYNLTFKENVTVAYEEGKNKVIKNPKSFNLMNMSDLQYEMKKLTKKIKQNPSKYGIKITKEVLESLDKGWSLLGTLAEINDISIFKDFKIIWIFADGEFKGYSPYPEIRRKIRNAHFPIFNKVPKNAGLWLYK